ncbi:hypothetical protein CHS0354_016212, partial [Potamilus streckersoni]
MPSSYENGLRHYHCYLFLWSVLSLLVRTGDIPIDQFNSCTAVINKRVISLQPLAKRNGPRIFTVYNSWNYSFNPCFSFDEPENPHEGFGDQCLSVLVCKFREENNRKFYYTLGFQAGAKFQASVGEDGNTTVALIYQGFRSFRHRKTFVTLVCDRNRTKDEDALFVIKEDKGKGNIEAELHHLCSCIDGCPNVTLTQVTSATRPQEDMLDLDSKIDPGVDEGNTSIIRN